ncbi:MAG TPA: heme ABC exporter ATP-binding protein CcmA [Longimicrobiales bacterium]|nr:heme ABC exporter ATP-binding protein CcmA [Longimicrobiales bacterium]
MTTQATRGSNPSALALRAVARRYGRAWALRGVDLKVEPGEAVALAGPNGSGKTTLLRVAATLLRPTRGSASVFGHDTVTEADAARARTSFLAHRTGLYEDLSARQNLAFAARMLGLAADEASLGAALERVGLAAEAQRSVRGFSAGMRRRLSLARILLAEPSLLLLDEPFASFDAPGLELLGAEVRGVLARGGSVVIATHDLERARRLVDRTVWLDAGRIASEPKERHPEPGAQRMALR